MGGKSIIFSLQNDFICNNGIWKRRCAPIVKGYKKSGNQYRGKRKKCDKSERRWRNNAIAEWSFFRRTRPC